MPEGVALGIDVCWDLVEAGVVGRLNEPGGDAALLGGGVPVGSLPVLSGFAISLVVATPRSGAGRAVDGAVTGWARIECIGFCGWPSTCPGRAIHSITIPVVSATAPNPVTTIRRNRGLFRIVWAADRPSVDGRDFSMSIVSVVCTPSPLPARLGKGFCSPSEASELVTWRMVGR